MNAFKAQLEICRVIDEDNGGLWFAIDPSAPAVAMQGLDLVYADVDNMTVEFILAFVDGHLNWVDRYRVDGAELRSPIPLPSAVRSLTLSP